MPLKVPKIPPKFNFQRRTRWKPCLRNILFFPYWADRTFHMLTHSSESPKLFISLARGTFFFTKLLCTRSKGCLAEFSMMEFCLGHRSISSCLTLGNKYSDVCNAPTVTVGLITHLFTTASDTIHTLTVHTLEMPQEAHTILPCRHLWAFGPRKLPFSRHRT